MDTPAAARPKAKQITVDQHVIAKSLLKRFSGADGQVEVRDLSTERIVRRPPKHAVFTVPRHWDQRSEAATMHDIERRFGIIVASVLRGATTALDEARHRTISEMFALWRARTHLAHEPMADLQLAGVTPERNVSADQMDQLERYGIIVADSKGVVAGRMLAGPALMRMLDFHVCELAGKRWGIVRAEAGEFVLPDTFGGNLVLPISPTCCFVADNPDGVVTREVVGELNALAKQSARNYMVARCFSACPGL
ncbi:DUF4238 domain-containing protein [Chitinolyticbacter meiyuanensis]|uniref:DUF4238 domain-containing protein n=1 Tax=Chitinolyticbacter meiyuanensis TaxID=682798 RepID=UPI0011E5AA1C|nr:DUF4238 domain-containing protein [Chitinolyticbacter meiyuanensis]